MNFKALVDRLERFGDALPAVVAGLPEEQTRWKPADDAWSILEIVTHMADEEVEDFRARVESTLSDPEAEWSPIDPEGVAVSRKYNEGDLAEVVERFVRERRDSVRRLRALKDPDWSATYRHPRGALRAGDVMASWVAHDALHLRQISKRLLQLTQRDAPGYDTRYAGEW